MKSSAGEGRQENGSARTKVVGRSRGRKTTTGGHQPVARQTRVWKRQMKEELKKKEEEEKRRMMREVKKRDKQVVKCR